MELMKKFKEHLFKQHAYGYVMRVVGWDSATEAPKKAFARRAEMQGVISGELFKLSTDKEFVEVVNGLFERLDELDDIDQRQIKYAKRDLDKILKIPQEDFVEYNKLVNLSQRLWEDAKAEDDFELFRPNLEKIIEFKKKFVEYYEVDDHPYNVLLDDFEEGMNMEIYDAFFNTLKEEIVPFIKEVLTNGKPLDDAFLNQPFAASKQKEFSEYLMEQLCFDKDAGLIKESVHPFTWNTHPSDVRFTTRYLEDLLLSSIFASIHELGHATYEQQIDEKYNDTNLGSGTSMGIHESQSRFYENIVGRSKEFWEVHYPKMQEIFKEELKDVSLEDFYRATNKVEASFIRVEADELTYPLHIMVRYEIERMLMTGEVEVKDLPEVWNAKYVEYLGIEPKNNTEGVLQDVHWSAGLIGYFPTYALGSAYAAQFYYAMKKEFDVEETIRNNDIKKINAWLKEKIHQFGKSKTPDELLLEVTGEPFDAKYYVQYLKEKYTKLYL
jgi:carboxypeptidase Taq